MTAAQALAPDAGSAAGPPALTAEHLCRRFRGVTAVADVSLRIPPGPGSASSARTWSRRGIRSGA